jgi:hypothetical protein
MFRSIWAQMSREKWAQVRLVPYVTTALGIAANQLEESIKKISGLLPF